MSGKLRNVGVRLIEWMDALICVPQFHECLYPHSCLGNIRAHTKSNKNYLLNYKPYSAQFQVHARRARDQARAKISVAVIFKNHLFNDKPYNV